MKNVLVGRKKLLTSYRKIAIAGWNHPRNPSTFTSLTLPLEPAELFMKAYPATARLTLTHYVAKITGHCLTRYADLNHLLQAGHLRPRLQADIFILVLLKTPIGEDYSGFVVRDVPGKSLGEFAEMCRTATERLRNGKDNEVYPFQRFAQRMPSWFLTILMRLQDFLQYTLNLDLSWLKLPRDVFGSAVINNIGALGVENAFVPLPPYGRCPLVIVIGKPGKMPFVTGDSVVVRTGVTISFIFDHRYADGAYGARILRLFKKIFVNPHAYPEVFESSGKRVVPKSSNECSGRT